MNVSVANVSSPNAPPPLPQNCFSSRTGSFIFAAFTFTNVFLLLPLAMFILVLGVRRWQKQHGGATANPADAITYHMLVMELIGICGSVLCCSGAIIGNWKLVEVGGNIFVIVSCVKMGFHVLTCVERYLAIVHPITYLSLSKKGGVRIRNISTGCVWLLCTGLMVLRFLTSSSFNMILFFSSVGLALIVISFCSVSVLCVLIRPGPGEGGGAKGKTNNSKQRAFNTIMVILSFLLLRFGGNLVCFALLSSSALGAGVSCIISMSGIWFCLPTSYVLPLLFLHRAGKLHCFRKK